MSRSVFDEAFEPRFAYMRFARTEALGAQFALTQSGMPAADPKLFDGCAELDLGFAGKDVLPRLRAAIGAHVGAEPDDVLVTSGASGAMHLAASVVCAPGTRVASETPAYEPLHALPRHFGAELATFERTPSAGWRIDPAAVARALTGARRGHVSLTNPHNPSGVLLEANDLVALAREAERAGGILISNEIYAEYVPAARRVRAHRLAPNTLSLGSLTKAYGLGALRIGWVVLGTGLAAERERFEEALFLDYVDPPTPALRLGLHAFGCLEQLRAPIARCERESKPEFASWLAASTRFRGAPSEFGMIAFPEVLGVGDTRAFARHLRAEHGVGVVPGEFFQRPGHVRIGFGLPLEPLREALARLDRGYDEFRRL